MAAPVNLAAYRLKPQVQKDFRSAMGSVAAAVSVVTALDGEQPHGTTVSAFGSLSMSPPMMFVSLDNGSALLGRLAVGSRFGVNVLAAHHDQVAVRFAQRGLDKFAGVDWRTQDGAPALADRHAWIALTVAQLVPAGDHTVVLGDVVSASTTPGAPLTYWQRSFGTHKSF